MFLSDWGDQNAFPKQRYYLYAFSLISSHLPKLSDMSYNFKENCDCHSISPLPKKSVQKDNVIVTEAVVSCLEKVSGKPPCHL